MSPSGAGLWSEASKSRARSAGLGNLKTDLADAIARGRVAVQDVELAADIVMGIWVQVTRRVS